MKASRNLFELFQEKLAPKRSLSTAGEGLIQLLDDPHGWKEFLKAVGPKTFTKPFAEFHCEFWDWYWHLTKMRRDKVPLSKEVLTFLAAWPRGAAKSSNLEWACILEGAMGLPGYVLYVSLTQASANSHVADIRKRLESEEVSRYFPDLAQPLVGKHNNQYGWRQNFLMTKGGWAIRPVGLDVAVRGFKEGDLRPTMIIFDDIDDMSLSIDSVMENLQTISRAILPAGKPETIHLIGQNLIAEHCAVNMIYERKTDILQDHISSMYPAFDPFFMPEKVIDEKTGKARYELHSGCVPTWEGMDVDDARINLNKSGLEAFMAEYQHDFSLEQSEKVIPEYDDDLHVISWGQFKAKFDLPNNRIPKHWQAAIGLDIGFTPEHLSAWTWICVSAEDSELPYAHFVYRGRAWVGKSINEQVELVLQSIVYRDEHNVLFDERSQYVTSKMSHEKLGERMVLNREYDFGFSSAQFGKEDGVAQWRSLLRPDRRKPHPFHADVKDEEGYYHYGRPSIFYIVDDDQVDTPRDDDGLQVHRAQVHEWRRKKTKLTGSGVGEANPMKYKDDANDSTRMLLAEEHLTATPLTRLQRRRVALKEATRASDLTLTKGSDDYTGVLMRRQMEIMEIERSERENQEDLANAIANVVSSPIISSRFRRRF